jgi:hypothetical protein
MYGDTKTLVIVLSETRGHELTFSSFKKNVIDVLNADLCLCIGVKNEYDYENPYYKLAKYKFLYDEPDDFGDAFDYAYEILRKNQPKYEKLNNINTLHGVLSSPTDTTENIRHCGLYHDIDDINDFNDNEIVIHTKDFHDDLWKNQVYGIMNSTNDTYPNEDNVITYKKSLQWREFLKIKNQFMGGVKDNHNSHPGSAGILIFFRWFLLQNIIESGLINQYERFVITRSDYIYQLPHPKVEYMDENSIWIPDCEDYGGFTDRHVVLSNKNIEPYLNIFNNMVIRSNDYYSKMVNSGKTDWNLEQLIKFHLEQNNVEHLVKNFPYIMYTVRNINGSTRWAEGSWNDNLGYYVKYSSELSKSSDYKNEFENSGLSIDDFYINKIKR